jgi:hypothetical protein
MVTRVSVIDEKLQAARNTREYRVGIWAMRIALLELLTAVALSFSSTVHDQIGSVGNWIFFLSYAGAVAVAYLLLYRVGVRIFGFGDKVWACRRMVYSDIFVLGRRGSSSK